MGPNRVRAAVNYPYKPEQPLGAARFRAACGQLLYERPMAVLLILFLSATTLIIWHSSYHQSTMVNGQALKNAERMAATLVRFRDIYTSEVVERIRQQGIPVVHDYDQKEGAIPLPATLSMMLGNRIGAQNSEPRSRLYSAFPFPWRRTGGGLTDDFARDAWKALTENPNAPFYRFEDLDGVPMLRYATADPMRPACLDCHNSHPDSPKTDWKAGDLRGVLEILSPMEIARAESHEGAVNMALLMLSMTLGGLFIVGILLGHLRRVASQAQDFAEKTQEANTELELEAAERQRAEEALRTSESKFSGILDIAQEAVISVDDRHCIQMFNQGAAVIFGYTAGEVLGQSLEMLMPSRFRKGHRKKVEGFAAAPEISRSMQQRGELLGLRKDGTEFPVEASISKLARDGETIFTVILTDITERKKVEQSLLAAKEGAESANRAKSEFLATMSHELRTPLNAILGFSELMRNESLGPIGTTKYRDYAGDINETGRHLLNLINDILDLSKVESGVDKIDEENVDVPEALRAVEVLVTNRAGTAHVDLVFECSHGLPALRVDIRKLKQILVNLISNAIKFTPAGGSVTVKAWFDADSGYVFQIADTGIGISPEDLPKALSQFGQVDSGLDRRHEGTGLGLPLTKSLVELHGGTLELQSTKGAGTTVTVHFPPDRIVTPANIA